MKEIPLTKGQFTFVDDEDFDYLNQWKWHLNKGYAKRTEYCCIAKRKTSVAMHRILLKVGADQYIDHINGNKLDNVKTNLRICSNRQNQWNARKKRGSKSEYKGVTWNAVCRKWQAKIYTTRKGLYLGLFETEIEAARAYNKAALEYYKEFARLNYLEEVS